MPSPDVYRWVGRGGAGNRFRQGDVQNAAGRQLTSQDLEAHKLPTEPASSGPVYTRAGRGGAGNFLDPVATGVVPPRSPRSPRSADAWMWERRAGEEAGGGEEDVDGRGGGARRHERPPRPASSGLSGRGGAGNWNVAGHSRHHREFKQEDQDEDEEQRRKRQSLEATVLRTVEQGLAPPPRAYRCHERLGQ